MDDLPIVISGFGRSGTTWLSDILSKVIGGLILFEPFHPAVYHRSHRLCYAQDDQVVDDMLSHLDNCLHDTPENFWLLRNHLKEPIDKTSTSFVKYIWENSRILGFKTIRSNHLLHHFHLRLNAKIIFIHRHPFAVLSSIRSRKNFWKEYGWVWHLDHFYIRTLTKRHFRKEDIEFILNLKNKIKSKDEHIILMWAISLILTFRQARLSQGYVVSYESLYRDPYTNIRDLLRFLEFEDLPIHPSHIFTPSLTTLNTVHHHQVKFPISNEDLNKLFWKDKIGDGLIEKLLSILQQILVLDTDVKALAERSGYLSGS